MHLNHLHDAAAMLVPQENAVVGQTNLDIAIGGIDEYGLSNVIIIKFYI